MPGLDGLLTARLIKEQRPDQAIMLSTACLDADLEQKATRAGITLCVEKADGILTLETTSADWPQDPPERAKWPALWFSLPDFPLPAACTGGSPP